MYEIIAFHNWEPALALLYPKDEASGMRYLVATDGSTESDTAVEYATKHAVAMGATLEIVHVITPETELVDGEVVLQGPNEATDRGYRTLEHAESLAEEIADGAGKELTIETHLLTGRPADTVADRANSGDADAVYVGHRGLSDKHEDVVGSVAKSIVSRATVPVTVVR